MPKWTRPQQNAIDARNSNILVSAAAGSGKTAVLVERVIKLITDVSNNVDVDRLLIVTFTNAAAAEMKSRISKKLLEIIKENPNDTNARRQLSLLPNVNVCTIDSFCINLVRESFYKLNIDQDFKILDNSENALLEQEAMDEVMDELYDLDQQDFKELVDVFSSTKDDRGLVQTVSRISHFINSQEFPNDWLDEACEMYNPKIRLEDSYCASYVINQAKSYLQIAIGLIEQSLSALNPNDDGHQKLIDMLNDDNSIIHGIYDNLSADNWDDLVDIVNNVSFSRMSSVKCSQKELVKANRDTYKEIISKSVAPMFSIKSADYTEDCMLLYPIVKQLVDIVKRFNDKAMELKLQANSFTFSDIEHFAINLLFYKDEEGNIVRTELAKELEGSFYEILVDEYQDTNSAQDKLFEVLSNGKNRFMVGDIKQSIYRFRLAMPHIFNEKMECFSPYSESADEINKRIDLSNNFRSRKDVCEFANFVCSHLMSKTVGGVDYDASQSLNASADYIDVPTASAQIKYVQVPDDEDADEYEAHKIAQYIIEKVKNREQIKDGNGYRDIRYSDFAILLRTAKKRMNVITNVFSQYSIPTVANNKTSLFDNNEIIVLINLLRTIDNPTQDISLLATLMSVFYGYSADDISLARVNNPRGNLYSAICTDRKFDSFCNDLKRYRELASSMSVENLLRCILSETSYLSIISTLGNHEQRVQNVMLLVDMARRFDNGENVGLTSFIRYLDTVIDNGFNVESASVNNSGRDAVNIMTIHHSKGLEFPVCILAGANHKYNRDELTKGTIQLNAKNGIGLKVYDKEKLCRYDSLQYSVIKDVNSVDLMSENLRVLYVAMTRAKEQFVTFISVSNKSVDGYVDSVSKKLIFTNPYQCSAISPYVVKKAANDAELITLCALLHKDADCLRSMCSNENARIDTDLDFDMDIEILDDCIQPVDVDEPCAVANAEMLKGIEERLSYCYDRLELASFSSKRTASSLDSAEQDFKYLTASKPAFLSKSNMTSAQRGTAMHTFMQFCDYRASLNSLDDEISRLVSKNYLTQAQADCLDRNRLMTLFGGEFAERMFNSDNIFREIKVSSFVPVCDIEDTDFEDEVLVQGIADCVFEENGELVLVDYKTDRVENEQELLDRYKNQIGFYKDAVSKALKKPVKEAVIYSFYLNKLCVYK